jgi:hypothetical protein
MPKVKAGTETCLKASFKGAEQGAGKVCGAKRIRSLYLPWITGVPSKLSITTLPKGLASLFTINDATMRLCRADLPATAHSRLALSSVAG